MARRGLAWCGVVGLGFVVEVPRVRIWGPHGTSVSRVQRFLAERYSHLEELTMRKVPKAPAAFTTFLTDLLVTQVADSSPAI